MISDLDCGERGETEAVQQTTRAPQQQSEEFFARARTDLVGIVGQPGAQQAEDEDHSDEVAGQDTQPCHAVRQITELARARGAKWRKPAD